MSRKSAIYQEYVQRERDKYPTFFQPQTFQYQEAGRLAGESQRGEILTACCRFWSGFGEARLMPDGRVFEVAPTTSGMSWVVAIFMSRDLWDIYRQPMSFRQYFEIW